MTHKRAAGWAALAMALALAACAPKPVPSPASPVPDPAARRVLPQGALIGYAASGAHVWRAIPFAAPPVGELRWRAPRPPARWEGERAALTPAPWCVQRTIGLDAAVGLPPGLLKGQEDCLTLDVYAPAFPPNAMPKGDAALPVMVWIHGGANVWGRAESYEAGGLAARTGTVVVVIQYRLGPLGWFAHPALRASAETVEDLSANFGTLDQIAALGWVRDNIAAFGGDPARVTIFGESAGGHNVASLLASPRAKGLFHRAIIQSGIVTTKALEAAEGGGEDSHPQAARVIAGRLLGEGSAQDEPEAAARLRAVSVEALFGAYGPAGASSFGFDPPRVIGDAVVLPREGIAWALADPARFNAVPVIAGTNRDETKLFNALNPALVERQFGFLLVRRDPVFYERASRYQSLFWAIRAVNEPARAMTAGGHKEVWAYRFDWDDVGGFLWMDLRKTLGAAHAMEIPFVFNRFRLLGAADRFAFRKDNAASRAALSDAMMSYWGNFAATGDPGRGLEGDLPEWTRWTPGDGAPKRIIFDAPTTGPMGVRMSAAEERQEAALAALAAEPALATDARRCQVFDATVAWFPELDAARARFLDGACAQKR